MISKVFDKSSPLLFSALTWRRRGRSVRLEWYRTSSAGTQEHYFTIELEGATIVDIQSRMPNCQDPSQCPLHPPGGRVFHLSQDRLDPRKCPAPLARMTGAAPVSG